jgi:hypothetical protein
MLTKPRPVERTYWHELGYGPRRLYTAAAALQRILGDGFSSRNIAAYEGLELATVRCYEQQLKAAELAWKEQVGGELPLRLPGNSLITDHSSPENVYFLPEPILRAVEFLAD